MAYNDICALSMTVSCMFGFPLESPYVVETDDITGPCFSYLHLPIPLVRQFRST